MSLELVNTLAGLLTVTVVSAAAVAALVQLRHLRAANQINAVLALSQKLDDPAFTEALSLMNGNIEAAMKTRRFARTRYRSNVGCLHLPMWTSGGSTCIMPWCSSATRSRWWGFWLRIGSLMPT